MSTIDAYLGAALQAVALLRKPEIAAAWEQPSALAAVTVSELADHLAYQIFSVDSALEGPASEHAPIGLLEHYARVTWIGAPPGGEANAGTHARGLPGAAPPGPRKHPGIPGSSRPGSPAPSGPNPRRFTYSCLSPRRPATWRANRTARAVLPTSWPTADSNGPFLLSSSRSPLIRPAHPQPRVGQSLGSAPAGPTASLSPRSGDGTRLSARWDGARIAHVARRMRPGYTEGEPMSGTGWGVTLGIIYFVLLVVFAVLSFRKGHWVLGLIGFIFPILWVIGAILPSRYARR